MEIVISNNIKLLSTKTIYAKDLFDLINKNRDYLRKWLPRTDKIDNLEKYKEIISNLEKRFEETKTGAFVIFYENEIVGTLDLQLIDKDNNIGGFGYWIDEDFQGYGIITQSLQQIINYAFDEIRLHKLIIQCVVENVSSIKVAGRLGFEKEAIFKNEFLLNGKYHDLVRYSLFNPLEI